MLLTAGLTTLGAALDAGVAADAPDAAAAADAPGGNGWPTVSVDPAPTSAPPTSRAAAVTPTAAYPLDRTFLLHSKPGSQRTIFLDFDGATISGTRWNSAVDGHPALPAGAQPGWSVDASAAFSDTERSTIQDAWQAVAEDYAPFDVDVTTEQPSADALDRTTTADLVYGTTALVTGGSGDAPRSTADDALCNGTCAGIAYNGVFSMAAQSGSTHSSWQPAFVFGERLADAHSIADAVSHEVGHNLGLEHDGTASAAYYAGQGAWGPMMGSPSNYPVTQWSKGEYAGADQTQDDLAIIGSASGTPLRADDAADTAASATPLPVATGTPSATGTITTAADVDVFALGTCTGSVTMSATPAATYSPDVDLSLAVLAADGSTLVPPVDQPTTRTSRTVAAGLGASTTYAAGTGTTLFVRVDGVGSGSPASSGYGDYGSLGRYLVDVQGSCSGAAGVPGTPVGVTASASGTSVTLSWSPPASAGTSAVTSYVVTSNAGDNVVVPAGTRSATFAGLAPGRTYAFGVSARNARGSGLPGRAEAAVDAPVVAGPVAGPTDSSTTTTTTTTTVEVVTGGTASTPAPGHRLTATTRPSLLGVARIGRRLVVRPGAWSRPTTLTYRWYVGGVAVRGAAAATYRPRSTEVGRALTARVTAVAGDGSRVVVTLRAGRVRR